MAYGGGCCAKKDDDSLPTKVSVCTGVLVAAKTSNTTLPDDTVTSDDVRKMLKCCTPGTPKTYASPTADAGPGGLDCRTCFPSTCASVVFGRDE